MTCFGEEVLAQAQRDLGSSSNYGIPGVFCSRAVQVWIQRAGGSSDIPGDPLAKGTMRQFQVAGRWISLDGLKSDPSLIQPGMIAVWYRGNPDGYTGHIGVVSTVWDPSTSSFGTVEANAGPKVGAYRRHLDINLIGMGYWPCGLGPSRILHSKWGPAIIIAGATAVALGIYYYRHKSFKGLLPS